MLETDHNNFFSKNDLENLISKFSTDYEFEKREQIPLRAINLPDG